MSNLYLYKGPSLSPSSVKASKFAALEIGKDNKTNLAKLFENAMTKKDVWLYDTRGKDLTAVDDALKAFDNATTKKNKIAHLNDALQKAREYVDKKEKGNEKDRARLPSVNSFIDFVVKQKGGAEKYVEGLKDLGLKLKEEDVMEMVANPLLTGSSPSSVLSNGAKLDKALRSQVRVVSPP